MHDPAIRPRIYFHHIPKTAGTSLREFLVARVGEINVAPVLRTGLLRDALRDHARFAVITGHLQVLPGDALPSDRVSITLLRDPVDRVVSSFYFQKSIHSGGRHGAYADDAATELASWLASLAEEDAVEALNGQLASLWPFGWDAQSVPTMAERVAAAKRALDAFDAVGLQATMAESFAMISYRLGLVPPAEVPHANRTPARPLIGALPVTVARRMEDLLAPDLELYDYGVSVFSERRLRVLRAAAASSAARVPMEAPGKSVNGVPSHNHPADDSADAAAAMTGTRRRGFSELADFGTREVQIENVSVKGEMSGTEYMLVSETTILEVRFNSSIAVENMTVGFAIRDDADALVFGTNTRILGESIALTRGVYTAVFRFPNDLGIGRYWISITLHLGSSHLDRCLHFMGRACKFEVVDRLTEYFEGRVRLRVRAKVMPADENSRVEVRPIGASGNERFTLLAYRNPALTEFSARLEPLVPVPAIPRAADAMLYLMVENTGSLVWEAYGKRPVTVSYHWFDASGRCIVFDGLRTNLPHDVKPGDCITLPCFVRAPEVAGRMTLVWTLVQEDVAWFDEKNAKVRFECQVNVA